MVECVELHVGGVRVDPLGWMPLLLASLDFTNLGIIINTNRFTLGTIYKNQGSA